MTSTPQRSVPGPAAVTDEHSPQVAARADELLAIHQRAIWSRTDRLFAALLACEWLAGVLVAAIRTPWSYEGGVRSIHPHLWAATLMGGVFVSLPIWFAFKQPGSRSTRHAVAVSQMLMSGLLIHLGDGRIEMHFHIFGSFAFLAFYRDWRVLVTGFTIVATDHLYRGLLTPLSVFGVEANAGWRTLEHALWVVFENVFLIVSCVQGVREMRGIATNRALLEQSYQEVERKVLERTRELKDTQDELLKSARTAGMAEIATSVLHNVGNVLNSVNVSATVVADRLKASDVPSVGRVSELLAEHRDDLGKFITSDERGRMIPDFLAQLAGCLNDEQAALTAEVAGLAKGIDHIKQIVAAQQSMAKKSNVRTRVEPSDVVERALSIQQSSLGKDVVISREFDGPGVVELDEHKVLQILVNLISNARQAVEGRRPGERRIALKVGRRTDMGGRDHVCFAVVDSGVGIAAENLTRIFAHGFTTKREGHGFGLHSAANAAREMDGSLTVTSDGVGTGATFTLEIPVANAEELTSCQ